jgi:tetratricopeptide (TPR) repeat protein
MRSVFSVLLLSVWTLSAAADLDSLRAEAQIAVNAGETAFATSKLQQIIGLAPDDGAAHFQVATLMMDNGGDLYDAISHFERARELEFRPQGVAYRLSRIYARTGRKAAALEQIELLANGGFALVSYVDGHEDYASIQDEPRFIAAVATIAAARYPCEADERRHAFDFWIGEWTVTAGGQFAGANSIQPILGHCTIFEQWESASGTLGKSFNYYDPGEDHWRQIWISDTGSVVEFTGEARDGGIFYTAATTDPADGAITLHKFEFTQIENGIVRQYWETSTDDGETWAVIWDGRYERKTE